MLIKTIVQVMVPAGVRLLLTPEQQAARAHSVVVGDDGVALTTHPQVFKSGEFIEFAGDAVPGVDSDHYEVVKTEKPPKVAKSKPRLIEATGDE